MSNNSEYPSRGWQPILTAPKDGSWVWGEWPEIAGSSTRRGYPRLVAPMRWGKPYRGSMYEDHWCMEGRWTPGPSPDRWFPINAPPPQGTEARSAETERLGPKDDGPVAEGHAPALTEAGRLAIKEA